MKGCFLVKFFTWLFHVSVFHLGDDSVLNNLVGIWETKNYIFLFQNLRGRDQQVVIMILKLFYYENDSRFVQFDSIEKGCRNVKLPLKHLSYVVLLNLFRKSFFEIFVRIYCSNYYLVVNDSKLRYIFIIKKYMRNQMRKELKKLPGWSMM